jgi:hypothetical protein
MYKYIRWTKKNPFKDMLIQIGGILYSYDKLADIYGIKNVETKNTTKINEIEGKTTDEVIESTLKEIDTQLTDEEYNDFMIMFEKNLKKK